MLLFLLLLHQSHFIIALVCAAHKENCTECGKFQSCDEVLPGTHDTDSCVAIVDLKNGHINILLQSCFKTPLDHPCGTDECELTIRPGQSTYFCCCRSHLCNELFSLKYPDLNSTSPTTTAPVYTNSPSIHASPPDKESQWTLHILAVVAVAFLTICVS